MGWQSTKDELAYLEDQLVEIEGEMCAYDEISEEYKKLRDRWDRTSAEMDKLERILGQVDTTKW